MSYFTTASPKMIATVGACTRLADRIFKKEAIQTALLLGVLLSLLTANQAFGADESGLHVQTLKPGAVVTVERELNDEKLLLSVSDAAKEPLFGLLKTDFVVTASGRMANIISAQPVEENLSVPRHIVLVLDNSDSMRQRHAIKQLLAGVDELLKIVRPIDQVQIVFFSKKEKMILGGHDLRVRTFASNQPSELKNFIAEVYRDGITSTTVLYDGILAGLSLIRTMPENDPRFLVVFSDGEDLNSAFDKDDVIKATDGIGRFNAYAIDYMPFAGTDTFLKNFAEKNRGQIWKANSETNLVPIFQSVASKMLYFYELSYLFPPTGSLSVYPSQLNVNELEAIDAAASFNPSTTAASEKSLSVISRIDSSSLKLKPLVDTAYSFTHWKVMLANAGGAFVEQDGEGAPPAEIEVPLKKEVLGKLAAGGDIKVSMEVMDSKGQIVVLSAPSIKMNYSKTLGSLTVTPSSIEINELEAFEASSASAGSSGDTSGKIISALSHINTSDLTLRPVVDSAYNFAQWKIIIANASGTLVEKNGQGAPPVEIVVPLPKEALGQIAAGGDIKVRMEILDDSGQKLNLGAPTVKMNYFKTSGSLEVAPNNLTIEEIKTIDSSPLLGQIYFQKGSSDLSSQYVRLSGQEETNDFDEQRFRDTLEKYYQVLNIIGKRLMDHPDARIILTGCNDNIGPEKENRKLSKARAETVSNYLQEVWNISPDRISIGARNLPEIPSTSRLEEGQAENRRVEIQADNSAILAPVRSTYLSVRIDAEALGIRTAVNAAHGVKYWTVLIANNNGSIDEISGNGAPSNEITVPLKNRNLNELATGGDIKITMILEDNKRQQLELAAPPIKVQFIQTSQRLAEKQDLKVQEKYALILFAYDSDTISDRNQEIVNTIVTRIKELPEAKVEIVGHTDTIGKEEYNIKLSQRRAMAVYKLLSTAYGTGSGDLMNHSGVGPNEPLFDNMTPESRAFNRTVTITLEYMAAN